MFKLTNLGKYKSIVVSIALFLLLDASVLMLNFYISFEIAKDAEGVNIAGRQRMLSQRMVKTLFDADYSFEDEQARERAFAELALTQRLFNSTLLAFDKGGITSSPKGEDVMLDAVKSPTAQDAIAEANTLWAPYNEKITAILANYETSKSTDVGGMSQAALAASLTSTLQYAKANNLRLLKLMNDLTVSLEDVAAAKASRLRMIQTIGILLAVTNFFIILFHFLAQLRENDKKLEEARRETTEILETVNEGLFLLDKNLSFGTQHSRKLEKMFGRKDLAGLPFDTLLEQLVSPKVMETAKRFIQLLFREDINSALIKDLNPLVEVEVTVAEGDTYLTSYYSFEFTRTIANGQIHNILVTVSDVTEKVKLMKDLEATREESQQQIEMLTGILHADPELLRVFIKTAFHCFKRINNLLREPSKKTDELKRKLQSISVEIHNFKGEAGALQLESFENLAHQFENALADLKENPELTGNDFLSLTVQLDKLIRHAELIKSLSRKLASFAVATDDAPMGVTSKKWLDLQSMADVISSRHNKKVTLVTTGLQELNLSDDVKQTVSDIVIQLVRNAIVHGVEQPHERLESQKKEEGRIDIRLAQLHDSQLELTVVDDGKGIDCEAIRQSALATGKWSEEELNTWDAKRFVSLIFNPDFSTAKDVSLDAGRGVGMEVVNRLIQERGGKIRVSSRAGRSTQFVITLPAANSGRSSEQAEKAA